MNTPTGSLRKYLLSMSCWVSLRGGVGLRLIGDGLRSGSIVPASESYASLKSLSVTAVMLASLSCASPTFDRMLTRFSACASSAIGVRAEIGLRLP